MNEKRVTFYSTNNHAERVSFETALLKGLAPDYGLYMVGREEIPVLAQAAIEEMRSMTYGEIALRVLGPFLKAEIPEAELRRLLDDAYREDRIPTEVRHVTGKTHIMWLTGGPTYSFKDYAARFFARALNYFLGVRALKRVVVVATSGDTGGAVADALFGLDNVYNVVLFPRGSVSEGQRKQMTTLGGNVYAFEVNGDFDVCQALAKNILNDREFAASLFGDPDRFTSANSISLGRLLPQAVYPFCAYSRASQPGEAMIASIPSGNFGDMMGTVIAKQMGLPISRIVCGVNENTEFPEFLDTGTYTVRPSKRSPSTAMIVSHPSNLARLIDFYGGWMYDERDPATGNMVRPGVIGRMPDMDAMRRDIYSISVSNAEHYEVMKDVYERFGVVLDPHGAVGWRSLDKYLEGKHDRCAVIYETADPGKFPLDVEKAIGITPPLPPGMRRQAGLGERVFTIFAAPEETGDGLTLSGPQMAEAREMIRSIFSGGKTSR